MSGNGFHVRPLASLCRYGEVSLVYSPRAEFEEVVAFHEEHLPASRWLITEVHDDRADDYRVRRFEVQRDERKGSIAVEESLEDQGPLPRKVVTVIVDIPCRE
jgi:hypothetical protein